MLREFFESSSGLAPMRQGLRFGSVISFFSGIAILFGAKGAAASSCPTTCSWDFTCWISTLGQRSYEVCHYDYHPKWKCQKTYCYCKTTSCAG